MRDALAGRVLELVRSREVDFGISSAVGVDAQLEFLPLTHDRIVAVMPLRHPLARHRSLTLEALLAHPLILMHRESSVRHIVDAAFAAIGRIAVPSYEAVYMASAMGMVRAGLGVTLLPSSAYEVVEARGVMVLALDAESLVRPVGIVKLRTRSLSPAAQAFLVVFAQHAGGTSRERRAGRR
jgi:DNA-binding transcriptional LysR family regulator